MSSFVGPCGPRAKGNGRSGVGHMESVSQSLKRMQEELNRKDESFLLRFFCPLCFLDPESRDAWPYRFHSFIEHLCSDEHQVNALRKWGPLLTRNNAHPLGDSSFIIVGFKKDMDSVDRKKVATFILSVTGLTLTELIHLGAMGVFITLQCNDPKTKGAKAFGKLLDTNLYLNDYPIRVYHWDNIPKEEWNLIASGAIKNQLEVEKVKLQEKVRSIKCCATDKKADAVEHSIGQEEVDQPNLEALQPMPVQQNPSEVSEQPKTETSKPIDGVDNDEKSE